MLKTDLFDEACGEMHLIGSVGERYLALGIDCDAATARAARQRLVSEGRPAQCIVADVRRLPFRSTCLVTILSVSTLDHLATKAEIELALHELRRVLGPGGRLLLTMDNPHNPEVALRAILPARLVRMLRAEAFPLGSTVGPAEGREMLLRVGLQVVHQAHVEHAPRYIAIRVATQIDRACHRTSTPWLQRLLHTFERLADTPLARITAHYTLWIAAAPSDERARP
jgi:SAM-dependent methyltransferase